MWSVFKSHVKTKLREQMDAILAMHPGGEQSMAAQRMTILEEIARSAVSKITPSMLSSFVNRVEI